MLTVDAATRELVGIARLLADISDGTDPGSMVARGMLRDILGDLQHRADQTLTKRDRVIVLP